MNDCPSFITSPPCLSHLGGSIRKYFAKNTEYDEEEGMCFTFNKPYYSIFFLSPERDSACTASMNKGLVLGPVGSLSVHLV